MKSTGYPARRKNSPIYEFQIGDKGEAHTVKAVGIDDITDFPAQPNLKKLQHLFPKAPAALFDRPSGQVDILLGGNYCELQPAGGLERDGCQKEGLRLCESKFGCCWVISGCHKALQGEAKLTNNAQLLTNAVVLEDPNSLIPDDSVSIHLTQTSRQKQIPEFFAAEDLGVCPAQICGPCKKKICPDCDFRCLHISKEENEVVNRQEELLTVNENEQCIDAKYAFTEQVNLLKDNIGQAIGFQKSVERKLGFEIDEEAADLLRKAMYVDDLLGGGTSDQVIRFKGELTSDGLYTGTLPKILAQVGFKSKVIMTSGEADPAVLEQFGGKVLGHSWYPTSDQLKFKLTVNLSPKNKCGERAEPDLTPDDITKLDSIKFTKSNLLGFVNGIFDPSGVMGPFTIKLKLELRRLFKDKNSELEWHQSVPEPNRQAWISLLTETLQLPEVSFP